MELLKQVLKNRKGIKLKGKYVLFVVDDYGHLRISGQTAINKLTALGCSFRSPFDRLDTLENESDFDALFSQLRKFKDSEGNHPVFSAYSLVANPDPVASLKKKKYVKEDLHATYDRILGQNSMAKLWEQGIKEKLISPEFHGREHINLQYLDEALERNDAKVITNLQSHSFAALKPVSGGVHPYASYDSNADTDVDRLKETIADGVQMFKAYFKVAPIAFAAARGDDKVNLNGTLKSSGIQMIDKPASYAGSSIKKFINIDHYTGQKNGEGQSIYVRNARFEPCERDIETEVNHTMIQINAAFRMKKPAVISSHRLNFSGGMDEKNRAHGLQGIKILLNNLLKKHPDAKFIDLKSLYRLISS